MSARAEALKHYVIQRALVSRTQGGEGVQDFLRSVGKRIESSFRRAPETRNENAGAPATGASCDGSPKPRWRGIPQEPYSTALARAGTFPVPRREEGLGAGDADLERSNADTLTSTPWERGSRS